MEQIQTILVPIDFSAHSTRGLKTAIGLAKTFNAKIHLLHAYHLPVSITLPDAAVVPQSFWDSVRDAAARKLEKSYQTVTAEGVQCDSHLTAQTPSSAIVETARQVRAGLIVMGTRGLSGLKHVLLGSVAERTVRTAPCPVMTVKGDEE
jgi:nucleotide-binding universal stress UspA family protein